jgi:hypothetical protein
MLAATMLVLVAAAVEAAQPPVHRQVVAAIRYGVVVAVRLAAARRPGLPISLVAAASDLVMRGKSRHQLELSPVLALQDIPVRAASSAGALQAPAAAARRPRRLAKVAMVCSAVARLAAEVPRSPQARRRTVALAALATFWSSAT